MGRFARGVFPVVLLVGLSLITASCGHQSPALTSPTHLVTEADLALSKDHPLNVSVRLESERYLQITVVAEQPVRSCTLSRVAASDGSAVSESVAIEETPHGQSQGGKTYSWISSEPGKPGTYRVRLVGEGRIFSLVIDMAPSE